MILVDANLLAYASVSSVPQHLAAKAWLDERLSQPTVVGCLGRACWVLRGW
jgi:predicted nucleic acid-binding protein